MIGRAHLCPKHDLFRALHEHSSVPRSRQNEVSRVSGAVEVHHADAEQLDLCGDFFFDLRSLPLFHSPVQATRSHCDRME